MSGNSTGFQSFHQSVVGAIESVTFKLSQVSIERGSIGM
jgi:hypothetical protein